jgi:predicted neuraminidase
MLGRAARLGPPRRRRPLELQETAIVSDGFIFERSPNAMSHASTIAKTPAGLVAAWFAGTFESKPDVSIWLSRNDGGGWSTPLEVANGIGDDGRRHACWNPVLFQPSRGPLLLFYKVGPSPKTWWGMWTACGADGLWGAPRRLPAGILGPIKNKPVQLANGDLLCPSSTEDDGWCAHVERSPDLGRSWSRSGPVNDGRTIAAIQPSILRHGDEHLQMRLQMLCRTKQGRVAESWSSDGGQTWSAARLTTLPNPNSGTDAVSLADGRHLLAYNPSTNWRSPLNIALSEDGRAWRDVLSLAGGVGEYSYPAVIQAGDGLVHISYTWNLSRIRHVVIDPARLAPARADR